MVTTNVAKVRTPSSPVSSWPVIMVWRQQPPIAFTGSARIGQMKQTDPDATLGECEERGEVVLVDGESVLRQIQEMVDEDQWNGKGNEEARTALGHYLQLRGGWQGDLALVARFLLARDLLPETAAFALRLCYPA